MKYAIPQLAWASRRLILLACATWFFVAANSISNSAGLSVQTVRVASDSTLTPAAGPLTLSVNTLGDAGDTGIGDGHCDTDGNLGNGDQCTLRAAIQETNSAATGTDTVSFSLPASSTITLTTALPDIAGNLTINGPGANTLAVQRSAAGGTPNFRVFTINSGMTVTITGLTIANGNFVGSASGGGGILNGGTLTLTNSTVSGNRAEATSFDPTFGGGGIFNSGTLTLTNSTASGNTATPSTGGGGGIFNSGGTLTMTNSTVSGNLANSFAHGGGILSPTGTVILINSTVSGNAAGSGGGFGGGIYMNNGTLTVTNSTVSDNSSGSYGSGIYFNLGTFTLTNVTVSGNTAPSSSSGYGIFNGNGTANLKNTIVANNKIAGVEHDLLGAFTSQDYNLIGNTSDWAADGTTLTGATAHNILDQNAKLGPLASNGGPTQTVPPLPGSPAIDAGNVSNLPPDTYDLNGNSNTTEALPVDQRGLPRVINTNFDIGAVETNYAISATAGTPQSASTNTGFGTALKATVTESANTKGGIPVTFTAPASGASGTFPGSALTATLNTDGSGVATAPTFTANNIAGTYNVNAALGAGMPTTTFALTNITATPTATAVSSSANSSNLGQSVDFTAKVTSDTGATPTGTIQFKDGGANLGSPQPLNGSGLASFTTSSLVVGIHTITADYSGAVGFAPSSGTLLGGQKVGAIIQLDGTNYSVNESDKTVTIKLLRSGVVNTKANVSYATDDTGASTSCGTFNGMASSRCDYTTTFGTTGFQTGFSQVSVTVPINRDSYNEGPETFTVQFSNPQFGAAGGAFVGPTAATITINDSTPPAPNAIDDPTTFVRQHYLDFLNREPDQDGLDFWVSNFTQCNGDPQCLADQRINVSAAFFLSIEFQDTGYFVERLYKTAYGDATRDSTFPSAHTLSVPIVRLNEFLPDAQEVGRGVVVGQGSWQQQLADNKKFFTLGFVQRSRFTNLYGSLSNGPYVDRLNSNAGNPLSTSERQSLVDDLNTGAKTQAQVLQAIAEHPNLVTSEFNRAFVLMQFFGYLRRNPDDPQDHDYTGYDFWLTKLNSFTVPGDDPLVRAQKADMVKAFITSTEYRQRFGP